MHWGYEPSLDPRKKAGSPSNYNFWPSEERLPGLKETVTRYYTTIFELAETIMKLFALGFDLDEDFFDGFFHNPQVLLALNYYPTAASHNPEGSGLYAHADLEGQWFNRRRV